MARQRNTAKSGPSSKRKDVGPLPPFKPPPEVLGPFLETLDERHVYITHVDSKPADFKRKVFLVPVFMNICVAALCTWRVYHIAPYYLQLLLSMMGYSNETTLGPVAELDFWTELAPELGRRALSFALDFVLAVFLWPWPAEFCADLRGNGSPLLWRWAVGFRDREVVVRRSRDWDRAVRDVVHNAEGRSLFMARVGMATSPLLINEKTGYVLMDADWDLDWKGMIDATAMVDRKMAAIEAFRTVVLVFHEEYGWLSVDLKLGDEKVEDERRRQVFAFRDALAALGKEELFYRWIETVQFETSQPGGFGPEKQAEVAERIRDMFAKQGVNFDELWKESVGSDGLAGM
ncbi:hypothetical protein DL764_007855 [Monosporascus ibericus]|uniref:Uncharacterized protein n=1 Tax=Monosporascus ibericus TaxID=155417 RepID=A0A4Q4T245_9PEZI|nr:hypothetical protein DL764_007855 [Monosporascus ibericus]